MLPCGGDAVDALVDGVFVGDVHGHAHGLAAGLFDLAGDGVGAGLVQVGDGDGRAGARQGQRDFLANAAGGAGDDGDFSVQIAHAGEPPGKDATGRGAPADARGMA